MTRQIESTSYSSEATNPANRILGGFVLSPPGGSTEGELEELARKSGEMSPVPFIPHSDSLNPLAIHPHGAMRSDGHKQFLICEALYTGTISEEL